MTEPSIFLSHTHKDKPFARRLGDELRRAGARVWIDEAEIKLGDSLIRKIGEGIQSCDYLGVILSPDSVASEWVKREVEIAMNLEIAGKRVVTLPLLYRRCEIPPFLIDKYRADFTTSQNFLSELNKIKDRLGLQLTPDSFPFDQQTENLVHQIRGPLLQAQARLRRLQNPEERQAGPFDEYLRPVQSLLKRSELVLSSFQLLQAYSAGQYVVFLRPRQDVFAIVKELIGPLADRMDPSRNIRLRLDVTSHPEASLDRRLFEVAVANLIDNALKYSFEDSTVRVACSENPETVQVHFFNTGLIIPDSERTQLFQLGFRSEMAKLVTGEGAGYGLYLAHQIMMSHGGTVIYREGNTPNNHEFILDWPKQYSPDAA